MFKGYLITQKRNSSVNMKWEQFDENVYFTFLAMPWLSQHHLNPDQHLISWMWVGNTPPWFFSLLVHEIILDHSCLPYPISSPFTQSSNGIISDPGDYAPILTCHHNLCPLANPSSSPSHLSEESTPILCLAPGHHSSPIFLTPPDFCFPLDDFR